MENQTFEPFWTPLSTEEAHVSGFSWVTLVIKSLYSFIGITGIAGNGLILAMLLKIPALRNTTNLLIGHQSVIDFISSCLLLVTFLPPALHDMTDLWMENPKLAQLFCKLWVSRFFYWVAIKASTANLICLTLERYIAVVHPLKYREHLKTKEAAAICSTAWVFGLLVQGYQLPAFFVDEGICVLRYRSKTLAVLSGVWIFVMTLVVPLLVMAFAYISIFMALPRRVAPVNAVNTVTQATIPPPSVAETHTSTVNDQNDRATPVGDMLQGEAEQSNDILGANIALSRNHISERTNKQRSKKAVDKRDRLRRNVLSTMIIVSITYTLCWTPNQIYFLHFNLGGELDLDSGIYYFTVIAAAANMCLNPIIYAFKYKKFQKGMKQMLFGKRFSEVTESATHSRS